VRLERLALGIVLAILAVGARSQGDHRLFIVDFKEFGAALAPDAPAEKRAWALGYVAGVLDELNCAMNRSVEPPQLLKKDQSEVEAVARVAYQIFLEQKKIRDANMPEGLIGATAFVRGATVRLWKCELKRSR
jgi:hypothetical protein